MRTVWHQLDDILEDVAGVSAAQMNSLATKIQGAKSNPSVQPNKAADAQADSLHTKYEQAAKTMKKDEQDAAVKQDSASFSKAASSRKMATDAAKAEQAQRAKATGTQVNSQDQGLPPEMGLPTA